MTIILRHLSSFIAPILMCAVLPYLIVSYESHRRSRPPLTPSPALLILGSIITLAGLLLLVATIRMFIRIGQGTIMPWDPTRKLIVAGLYAHVRNPMILSLVVVQAGEALLFASVGIALLVLLNFVVNTIYFVYSEEPGLEKRFGAEYAEYKQNVPRWIPRLKPWRPSGHAGAIFGRG